MQPYTVLPTLTKLEQGNPGNARYLVNNALHAKTNGMSCAFVMCNGPTSLTLEKKFC